MSILNPIRTRPIIILIVYILKSIIISLIDFEVCEDTRRDCETNVSEWMCDPINNNEQGSGSFLTSCSKTCYDRGFDHGQCNDEDENGKKINNKIGSDRINDV